MREKLILNIINKKVESIQKRFDIELSDITNFLIGNKTYVGGFDINIDCASSLNVYFKGLENSDNEGVELYIHIAKTSSPVINIDLYLIRSSGLAFATDGFSIDLQTDKSVKCAVCKNLFDVIDNYYNLMKKVIREEYLPRIQAII